MVTNNGYINFNVTLIVSNGACLLRSPEIILRETKTLLLSAPFRDFRRGTKLEGSLCHSLESIVKSIQGYHFELNHVSDLRICTKSYKIVMISRDGILIL